MAKPAEASRTVGLYYYTTGFEAYTLY